jgi:hypothetical protein
MPMFALKYWREHVAVTVPTDGNLGACPHGSNRIILREMEVRVCRSCAWDPTHALRRASAGPVPCIAVLGRRRDAPVVFDALERRIV